MELIPADEPWIESEFEFATGSGAANHLAIKGEVIAEAGSEGQVMSVRRDLILSCMKSCFVIGCCWCRRRPSATGNGTG